MNSTNKISKTEWSWTAFILGPFWYLLKGLTKKGFFLLAVVVLSAGLAAPFIWIYCGVRAKNDLYERNLYDKSRFDMDKI